MTNLAISTVCNLNCPYCFAGDHMGEVGGEQPYISRETFAQQLDYLDRSGIDEARLLGGEPTLHPEFPALVAMARQRNKRIVVFSNGLMRPAALDCLMALPETHCHVMLNINAPALNPAPVLTRQKATLKRLGQRAMVGFNIYQPNIGMDFLLDVIDETACQRRVRLGMAQPCLSGENDSIRPHQYRFIAEKIVAFARKAAARQITLEFDCGFVRCMFTDDELAFLEANGSTIGWHCNPILDIDAHNQVIHCYPLTGVGAINLDATSTATTLRAHFSEQVAMYRQAGIFPECINCPLKQRGECTGGCLAVTMRRFRHSDFAIQVAEQEAQ